MKQAGRLLLCAWVITLAASWSWGADSILRLHPGETKRIKIQGVEKVVVEDASVAAVTIRDDRREVVVRAVGPGITALRLLGARGEQKIFLVHVTRRQVDVTKEILALLGELEGVEVVKRGSRVILEGTVFSKRDYARIVRIAKLYPLVVNLVHLDTTLQQRLLAEEVTRKIGLPDVQARVLDDQIILEGTVYEEADKMRAEKIAEAHREDVVNLIQVRTPMIEIELLILQVEQSTGETSGMNLLQGVQVRAGGRLAVPGGAVYGIFANMQSTLDLLVSQGSVTILTRSHLSTRSGQQARFHAGGEIGLRVHGRETADVKFKEYGLIFQIAPVVKRGEIYSHVTLEISAPLGAQAGQDVGFMKFMTESDIVSRPGESIIIAGLAKEIRQQFGERTPLLSKIPVLNLFFGKGQETSVNQDLVIMVTPSIPSIVTLADHVPASSESLEKLLGAIP